MIHRRVESVQKDFGLEEDYIKKGGKNHNTRGKMEKRSTARQFTHAFQKGSTSFLNEIIQLYKTFSCVVFSLNVK